LTQSYDKLFTGEHIWQADLTVLPKQLRKKRPASKPISTALTDIVDGAGTSSDA